ncbi:MAG: cyclic pyranopterin monophosphate synthase MoaC [Rhodobacteraceae bacterium]|nr:cyclic pyranopterin monophosphate synthase MoaC [Paracoccaceae bacterium]
MSDFTHFDTEGRARMVDISDKDVTRRIAIARGEVKLSAQTLEMIRSQKIGKGDVLAVARLAGIMAAKRTAEIVPLCHPLPLSSVEVEIRAIDDLARLEIEAKVTTLGRTGVEMEALTSVTAAALTVYDMVKSQDRSVELNNIRLLFKDGGKSGRFENR